MANEIVLRTVDHPEANGRRAKSGEQGWTLRFPLESGTSLVLKVGEQTFEKFREFLGQYTLDTMQEAEVKPLRWIQRTVAEWFTPDGWGISSAFSGEHFFVRDPTGRYHGPHSSLELAKAAAEEWRLKLAEMPNGG